MEMKEQRTDHIYYYTSFILDFASDDWNTPSNQIRTWSNVTWPGLYKHNTGSYSILTHGFLLEFTAPSCPSVCLSE